MSTREQRKSINPIVKLLNSWFESIDNVYEAVNIKEDSFAEWMRHNRSLDLYNQIVAIAWSRVWVKLIHAVSIKWWDINADDVFNITWYDYNFNF